jgi:diacylglycerol kinase (ATP)
MRAAAILGPGNMAKPLSIFQRAANVQWTSLIEQADAVVIFGGDGTIHRHLATLVELDVPLMVVPRGSGNDFARALRLRSVRDAAAAWRAFSEGEGNVQAIDLGLITEIVAAKVTSDDALAPPQQHYFCCIAGVGLDSQITRRANELPKWIRAHGGYGLCAPREFLRFKAFPMRISTDGHIHGTFQPTTLAAVANAPSYGGGMKIAPRAKLDDGKLDLCVVSAMNSFSLFCLFPTVYFGRHLSSEKVEYAQTETVRIEGESPFNVYADGEYVCKTPVEFNVARNALKVIVPK